MLNDTKNNFIYVCEDIKTKKVIGFIHAQIYESLFLEKGLNILGLAVLPENKGQGIGKKLINHLENVAKENLIKFIRLNSSEKRLEAHIFYEKNNYICDKKKKRFIKFLN